MAATLHFLLILLPCLSLFLAPAFSSGEAEPKVPAVFVFGDSTADVGNNNYMTGNRAKANFPHNGIDFPFSRPTGRFSNGYNGIDFLAMHVGFKRSPPPFLSLNNTSHETIRAKKGINFASGGSGILDSTGDTNSSITMTKQIQYFSTIRSQVLRQLTNQQIDKLFSKSLFLTSSGGNDIFAYFSQNKFSNVTEKKQFISTLTMKYEDHLKKLYDLGGRKFGIVDVPPIGCCPYSRSLNPTGGCLDTLNELAREFNRALKIVMNKLSSTLAGMKYSIGSSNAVIMNIVNDPGALGFNETKTACCGSGKFNAESGCTPNATLCSDRRSHLFWDLLHPTHATAKVFGLAVYSGPESFASPINFKKLVEDGN
ncbi:LOW QUALITY PROTEIN: GDSL esterase/lipase At5g55050-like [Dioscorea cayenensis subsp. rotundata]|uniref:LOW QUALITY PROTEIN: GDSL esterase/lipase At5g55050-like n=1 Tax=Dioscorea cayennensis subsp. rotundata TaxID=55577 RepID=A0AB40C410_DIOCR|nr:LOW QUALITY PROTEIN: GDSL esterase/lipase At5g55050-like [Dioscorea cayenensis subsp. rotundata]